MKKLNRYVPMIALAAIIGFAPLAHSDCGGDTAKNGFIESGTRLSFSGTGTATVASEILGYLQKAGSSGGVSVSQESDPVEGTSTSYNLNSISAYSAPNVCPPLNVAFQNSSTSIVLAQGTTTKINFSLNGQNALDLVNLMKAAGLSGTADPTLQGGLNYSGTNIHCELETPPAQNAIPAPAAGVPMPIPRAVPMPVPAFGPAPSGPTAQCWISLDPQN